MSAHRIIAPVTLAEDSLAAVDMAASFAAALGAQLVLAGIAPVASCSPATESSSGLGSLASQAERQQLVDRIISLRLRGIADALPDSMHAQTVLTWGPVGPALVTAAHEHGADLVVVPSRHDHQRGPAAAEAERYVLDHTDIPVLVVPTNGRPSIRLGGSG
jgi:nucleotide-binding universal stress UspA family protein